jgi:hypothetical protein
MHFHSPTSPTCFRGFDSCGIWLVAFLCACRVDGHNFSHSMITHELFWDLMDYLTPFHVGWDKFVDIFLEFPCWFTILCLWCFLWFFLCWSFESLSPLCSYITLALLFELISHGMLLIRTQWLLLWTKFCILLTFIISWVHLYCIHILGS